MLKLAFYVALTAFGVVASLFSPIAGAITALSAYLLNPSVFLDDPSTVRYQLYCTLAFLAGTVIRSRKGVARVGNEAFVLWAIWGFVAIGALSCIWAEASAQVAWDAVFEMIKTLVVATLLAWVIRDERDFRYLVIACIIGVWHASFLFTFGVKWGYVSWYYGRGVGGVLPDAQAGVLLLFVPLLVLLAMKGSKWERIASCVALPFVLDGLVETYERTAMVGLVVEIILLFVLLPKRVVLRLLPVVGAGLALFVFRLTPDDYWERMSTILAPTQEASANSRFVINGASRAMLFDHPMGVGYRNYGYVSPRYLDKGYLTDGGRAAHNSFYTILCDVGIPGFAAWITAFGGALWLLRGIRKAANPRDLSPIDLYAMGVEIGLYGWMAGGLTQDYQEVDPAYWFIGLAVVLVRLRAKRVETEAGETAELENAELTAIESGQQA